MNLELAYVLHRRVLEFDEFKIGLSFKYIIYTTVCVCFNASCHSASRCPQPCVFSSNVSSFF